MTFPLDILLISGTLIFCLGGLVGVVIGRYLMPSRVQRDLKKNLRQSQSQFERYQQDVGQHFSDASHLLGRLAQSYQDVQDHLTQAAVHLTRPEVNQQILEARRATQMKRLNDHQERTEEAAIDVPKDWAPETAGQAGTLSEEFGLEEINDEPDPQAKINTEQKNQLRSLNHNERA